MVKTTYYAVNGSTLSPSSCWVRRCQTNAGARDQVPAAYISHDCQFAEYNKSDSLGILCEEDCQIQSLALDMLFGGTLGSNHLALLPLIILCISAVAFSQSQIRE